MPLDPRFHAVRPDLADIALQGRVEARALCRAASRCASPRRRRRSAARLRRDATLLTEALCGEEVRGLRYDRGGLGLGAAAARSLCRLDPDATLCPATGRRLPTRSRRSGPSPLPARTSSAAARRPAARRRGGGHRRGGGQERPLRADLRRPARWSSSISRRWTPSMRTGWRSRRRSWARPISGAARRASASTARASCRWRCGRPASPRRATPTCRRRRSARPLPLGGGLPPLRRGDLVFWKGHVGIMRDAEDLLHANAHHMAVAVEPLRTTRRPLSQARHRGDVDPPDRRRIAAAP